MLKLDFTTPRREKAKIILEAIPPQGCSEKTIIKKTGIPQSLLSEIVDKLISFNILFFGPSIPRKGRGAPEKLLLIADPFLAFYSHVLAKYVPSIKNNKNGRNIFGEQVLANKQSYYIEGFSGEGFERLVEIRIAAGLMGLEPDKNTPYIFKKLNITSPDYRVFKHTSNSGGQLDLVVEDKTGRRINIIECKWGKENIDWPEEVNKKEYSPLEKTQCLRRYLMSGYDLSLAMETKMKIFGVASIVLTDLYERNLLEYIEKCR